MGLRKIAYDILYYTTATLFIIALGVVSVAPFVTMLETLSVLGIGYSTLASIVIGGVWYYSRDGNSARQTTTTLGAVTILAAVAAVAPVGSPLHVLYTALGLWLLWITVGLGAATYNHATEERSENDGTPTTGEESIKTEE